MLADTAGAADKAALTSFPAPDCAMPQGWPAIAERRPHYVIFGETHGTREAPAFVGRIACALASDGERLLVAVEQSATDNAALQAAWRLRSEEHTSELQSLMRTSYAVFCLKKKKQRSKARGN